MVGYVMVIYDYDIPEYDIWHMMIDASKQGKGYGGVALRLVWERYQRADTDAIFRHWIMHVEASLRIRK